MEVVGQRHAPPALLSGKREKGCKLCRRMVGPQGWCGLARKISPPPDFDPRTVQAVDYPIPVYDSIVKRTQINKYINKSSSDDSE